MFAQFEQIKCVPEELCLNYSDISPERFEAHIKKVLSNEIPTENLAALMPMKEFEKFDEYLDEKILDRANANDRLDIESARQAAAKALEELAGRHSQGPVRNETGFYEREIANQSSDGPK